MSFDISELSINSRLYSLNPNHAISDIYEEITLKLEQARSMVSVMIYNKFEHIERLGQEAYFHTLESMIYDSRALVSYLFNTMKKNQGGE